MKSRIVAISLLVALTAWIFIWPAKTAAEQPKVEIKTKPPEPYVSDDIIIKDNAILPILPNVRPNKNGSERFIPSGQTSTPTGGLYSGRHYSQEEVQRLIQYYSAQYGINPVVPLCIARLESGFNQFSKNKTSTASGVFQYLSSTWNSTDEGKAGLSVFDAEANVRAAIKYMASRKSTKPWVVGPRCPSLI